MINKSDPVKIFVTYGEAIELKNAGIADSFYKYFSHFKIPEDQDLYLIGTGFDFDRKWLGELLKKNHFDDCIISAFIMYGTIIPAIKGLVSPPINPTNLKDIVDREFSEQKKYFNNCLKSLDIENIIKRFCLPTPLFYPKTKIKHNSFFFWVDYGCTIRDECDNILRDEAINGNDLCFQVALLEFGNQDNQRLAAEWNDLIQTRFPKLEFYLSDNPLPKTGKSIRKAFLSDQSLSKITKESADNNNYFWAVDHFWESLKQYDPKKKRPLKNWLATGIKLDLENRYKKADPVLISNRYDVEELEVNGKAIDENIIDDQIDQSDISEKAKKEFKSLNKNKNLTFENCLDKVIDLENPNEKQIAEMFDISQKTIQRRRKKPK